MLDLPPPARLAHLLTGFWNSQAVYAAAKLDLGGLLKDGPRNAEELAQATGTHALSLYRMLRMLAASGVFHEDAERRFSLTPVGECLRDDVPGSLRAMAANPARMR